MQTLAIPTGPRNPNGHNAANVLGALQGNPTVTTFQEKEIGMTLVVADQGEEAFLDLILSVNYTLHLFSNNVTSSDAVTAASFTEANFTGYSAKTLTGGSWTTTAGAPTVGTYPVQAFTASADQTPQTIYGYYVTRTSDGLLLWFEKFTAGVEIELSGETIRVTPRMTLADTQD